MNIIWRGLTAKDFGTRALWMLGLAFAGVGVYWAFKETEEKEK